MDQNYIETRKKELETEFNGFKEQIIAIEKQADELNKKHAVLMDNIKRIQGAYAELKNASPKAEVIEPEVVSENV